MGKPAVFIALTEKINFSARLLMPVILATQKDHSTKPAQANVH
jgi:hypothetical protein